MSLLYCTHAKGLFVCNIKEFHSVVLEKTIFKGFCSKFAMSSLSMAIISPIIQVAPSFEQTLIKHDTQGLFE